MRARSGVAFRQIRHMGVCSLGLSGARAASAPRPIRLAIVDDHPVVREAFGNIFELVEGLEVVVTASDADEALERLASVPVDVAIVDYGLPRVDGGVLTARIKARYPA